MSDIIIYQSRGPNHHFDFNTLTTFYSGTSTEEKMFHAELLLVMEYIYIAILVLLLN